MSLPTVDLIVCTFGRSETVVSSVERSRPELHAFSRVLVVDNNPDGLPAESCARLERCGAEVVHEPAVGLSRARNRGLRESKADIAWFLDDDASLRPGFASSLRTNLDRIAERGAAARPAFGGGYILAASTESDVGSLGQFELSLLSCMRADKPFRQPWGANMFVDRVLACDVGGFDPELGWTNGTRGLLGEEDDLFLRMRRTVDESRRAAYFMEGCSVDHWIPRARRRWKWLLWRAFTGGRSNYVIFGAFGKRELLRGCRELVASPNRENLLSVVFLAGKRYQRVRHPATAPQARGAS